MRAMRQRGIAKLATFVCIGVVLLATFVPPLVDLPTPDIAPLWLVAITLPLVAARVDETDLDVEQPFPLLSLVSPRAPPVGLPPA